MSRRFADAVEQLLQTHYLGSAPETLIHIRGLRFERVGNMLSGDVMASYHVSFDYGLNWSEETDTIGTADVLDAMAKEMLE